MHKKIKKSIMISEKMKALCRQDEKLILAFIVSSMNVLVGKYYHNESYDILLETDVSDQYKIVTEKIDNTSFKELLIAVFHRCSSEGEMLSFDESAKKNNRVSLSLNNPRLLMESNISITICESKIIFEFIFIEKYQELLSYILNHIGPLFEIILVSLDRNIKEISLFNQYDQAIVDQANNTQAELKQEHIVERFFKTAKENAEQTALIFENEKLLYCELQNEIVNLSSYMKTLKVTEGSYIGVALPRGFEQIISMFAIWNIGCVFVPLDMSQPEERIAYIVEDLSLGYVISDKSNELFNERGLVTFLLENIKQDIVSNEKNMPITNVEISRELDESAYVIYTSGTTGVPKGILVSHKNLVNSIYWRAEEYAFNEQDTILQLFSIIFDGFLTSVLTPLISGASIVLANHWEAMNPRKIIDISNKFQVTSMIIIPTMLSKLLKLEGKIESLSSCTVAGENISNKLIKSFNKRYTQTILYNEYGPSETTIVATFKKDLKENTMSTIGKPISNVTIHILDNNMETVPVGVEGEIWISGKGVSKGYINRPELTAKNFRKNSNFPSVLYRTSDSARWLKSGEIEFLGRKEEKLKIRGFRIEAKEIEQILNQIHGVAQSFVTVEADEDTGENFLTAYIETDNETLLQRENFQKILASRLPDYMMPNVYKTISSFPSTNLGKLDKVKLQANSLLLDETKIVAPTNDIEKSMVIMWKQILGIDNVGIYNNFFELRGFSLLAIEFLDQVIEKYHVEIPVSDFFENPTIQFSAAYVNENPQENYVEIPVYEKQEKYLMTSAQKRIFITQQLEETETAYNMPLCLKLKKGIVNKKIIEALSQLVKNHPILTSSYYVANNNYFWKENKRELKVEYFTVSDVDSLNQKFASFIRRFDFSTDMLFRAALVKATVEDSMYLFIDIHHIISDDISIQLLLNEFECLIEEQPVILNPVSFSDYSIWQHEDDNFENKEFWLNLFSDGIPQTEFPTDYTRKVRLEVAGNLQSKFIDSELALGIDQFCRKTQVSDFQFFIGCLGILINKYNMKQQFAIGTPFSNRSHKNIKNMIGMFVTALPFLIEIDRQKSPIEYFHSIKSMSNDMLKHQNYPIEELASEISKSGNSKNSFFDIFFNFQEDFEKKIDQKNAIYELMPMDTVKDSKFVLTFSVVKTGDAYELGIEYRTDLFDKTTIQILLDQYIQIINEIVYYACETISAINISNDKEKVKISNFSENKEIYKNQSVIDLFKDSSIQFGSRIAVVDKKEFLSYSEFNNKSDKLAQNLISMGLNKGDRIGVYMDRSLNMLLVIFSILKAGMVYVPLEIQLPKKRIDYIYHDADLKLIIYSKKKPDDTKKAIKYSQLSAVESSFIRFSAEKIDLDSPAYVIYTSGTTGNPKGVEIGHRGLSNLIQYLNREYTKNEAVWLFKTPISFDVSITEIFGWFLSGGKVEVLPNSLEKDMVLVWKKIKQSSITHVNFVPALLKLFSTSPNLNSHILENNLEYIFSAGEVLTPSTAKDMFTKLPAVNLLNAYGPTETTVYASVYELFGNEKLRTVPIGRPVKNSAVYILDSDNHKCGINVFGEICVGGENLALSYVNKKELTDEKFKYCSNLGTKIYFTGDFGRWLPDGNIEFAGRKDTQIKIRGYRVELSDIETVLKRKEDIAETVLLVTDEYTGSQEICLYYLSDKNISPKNIKKYLLEELPNYMVPSRIKQISTIPTNANGKLDQEKLPKIEMKMQSNYKAPETVFEKEMCEVISKILKIDHVGIYDDFFDLGGSSITILQILSLLKFNRGASVNDFYESTNIKELCLAIEHRSSPALTKEKISKGLSSIKRVELTAFDNDQVLMKKVNTYLNEAKIKNSIDNFKEMEEKRLFFLGATGFFGIHLLEEILTHTNHYVTVLLRNKDELLGVERYFDLRKFYFGDKDIDCFGDRLQFVSGDLTQEYFGLAKKEYSRLLKEVEVIINCSANVKHYDLYENSYSVNVDAVDKLVAFYREGVAVQFNHFSTISLASGTFKDEPVVVFTEETKEFEASYNSVYLETKFLAEQKLEKERENGMNINIFRLGNLQNNSETGKFQINDEANAFSSIINYLIDFGYIPDVEYPVEYTPVDKAAKACLKIMNVENYERENYHIYNNVLTDIHTLVNLKARELGRTVHTISINEFAEKLIEKIDIANNDTMLFKFLLHLGLYDSDSDEQHSVFQIHAEKTNMLLEKLNFHWES